MLNNLFKCTGSIIKVLSINILIEQVQEQGNFIWSLKHLEEWVWRTASEECVWRNESEEELLKTRHQKQDHQKHWSSEAYLARSYFTRVDKGHCTKCTATNSTTTMLQCLSLQQDKDNSNIAADIVPFVLEWI